MSSLNSVRQALATTLANNITGLSVSADYVEQVNPPQAVIFPQPGQEVQFATMDGAVDYLLTVVLLQSWNDPLAAQQAMDALLDDGPGASPTASVLKCLRVNNTLGGSVAWAVPLQVRAYRVGEWAGQTYLRCELLVQVAA